MPSADELLAEARAAADTAAVREASDLPPGPDQGGGPTATGTRSSTPPAPAAGAPASNGAGASPQDLSGIAATLEGMQRQLADIDRRSRLGPDAHRILEDADAIRDAFIQSAEDRQEQERKDRRRRALEAADQFHGVLRDNDGNATGYTRPGDPVVTQLPNGDQVLDPAARTEELDSSALTARLARLEAERSSGGFARLALRRRRRREQSDGE